MLTKPVVLIGGGGHAKVVLDALLSRGLWDNVIVRDDNPALSGTLLLDRIIAYPALPDQPARFHVAIGDNDRRRRLSEVCRARGGTAIGVVHLRAIIAQSATIGDGCFIAAGATIAPAVCIEEGTIINHGAVVDHDCCIGAFAHVAPNVTLGGGVRVGSNALVGAGATILAGLTIGSGAIIGAGAVVRSDVVADDIVAGVPARTIR